MENDRISFLLMLLFFTLTKVFVGLKAILFLGVNILSYCFSQVFMLMFSNKIAK